MSNEKTTNTPDASKAATVPAPGAANADADKTAKMTAPATEKPVEPSAAKKS